MSNELRHLAQFTEYLQNYKLSPDALRRIADLRLTLLVAPSSSGRNTIIRELEKTGEFHFIVSDTTRRPRVNDGVPEQNGREYWFRAEEEMLQDIKNGEFLEAAVIHSQQVSGISIRELDRAQREHKIAIGDVEVVGAANIHRVKPDTRLVFVVPPDFDTWMDRLHGRGEMQEDEVRRRLESAVIEFEAAAKEPYYQFVVNDYLDAAIARVYEIARTGAVDKSKNRHGLRVVKTLTTDTRRYLSKIA